MLFLDKLSSALFIIIILLAVFLIGVQVGKKTKLPPTVHQMSTEQGKEINIHLSIT
jgi:hypothetical protein